MKKILITGGSGMIGTRLTKILESRGYLVIHLSRNSASGKGNIFFWDIASGELDEEALRGTSCIVHLAGENIGSGRWTERKKEEIVTSRVQGLELLFEKLKRSNEHLQALISASAVGIYRKNGAETLDEDSEVDCDFLGSTCSLWEESAEKFTQLSMRVVKIRTGVVLSDKGGALPKMAAPVKCFVGAPVGSGGQVIPWVHLDDICDIYVKAIEDETMAGAYNAVSPYPVTNRELTNSLGSVLNRPLILPDVPEFVIKLLFGELSALVLDSQKISPAKILKSGYLFKYPEIDEALRNIFAVKTGGRT